MKLAALFLVCVLGAAADWPQWRGPNRDGQVADAAAEWPKELKAVWKVKVGEGHSSPIVVKDRVYVHTRRDGNEFIGAYDLTSGKKLWEDFHDAPYKVNPAAEKHRAGPKATPAFANGKLFTFGIGEILSCLDAASGKVLWRKEFQDAPGFGTASSPIVDGNAVIVFTKALTAFDVNTGREIWQWSGDGAAYASPVIGDFDGVRQVITQSKDNLIAVSRATGELLWKLPIKTAYEQNSVTPLIHNGLVIYSGLSNPLAAVRPRKAGADAVWSNSAAPLYMSSPVAAGGKTCGMTHKNKGQFFCLDGLTGKTAWMGDARQGENAAIVAAGATLFALTNEGKLIVMKAANGEVTRTYAVSGTETWAHPAIAGNRVLIKDFDTLALWR